jgi:hypothetical protein
MQNTIEVLKARRKLEAVRADFEKQAYEARRKGKHQWNKIVRAVNPEACAIPGGKPEPVLNWVSLAMLGHLEALKHAGALNKAGIEKVIGRKLPEPKE